ncbi:Constitutive coactivator of peroxisome proliferator-activated receptor gamma [Frankliniella fusca]|uniref:Constitutive coactivator of peroxisome proliferator-activated receptor gamma n=1 Tax=Frankliniella fusca TaxID=407009 RepID=A0AAE1H917_9NEOP|nr:Constitutive coactivator of peroxisome proliferator-activated receptor gamma [Frankliniella fusca]
MPLNNENLLLNEVSMNCVKEVVADGSADTDEQLTQEVVLRASLPTDAAELLLLEVPVEAAEPLPLEVQMEAGKQPLEVPMEAAEQPPLQVPLEAAQQPPLEVPMEAAEQPPREVPMETTEQPPLEVPMKAAELLPNEVLSMAAEQMEAAEHLPQAELVEAAEQPSLEVSMETAEQPPLEHLPQAELVEAAEQPPLEVPMEVAEQPLLEPPLEVPMEAVMLLPLEVLLMEGVVQLPYEETMEDADQLLHEGPILRVVPGKLPKKISEQHADGVPVDKVNRPVDERVESDDQETDDELTLEYTETDVSSMESDDEDTLDESGDSLSGIAPLESFEQPPCVVPLDLVKHVTDDEVPLNLVKQPADEVPVNRLERLPDDVLVAVLSLLSVPDVLTCRLVSRRLGELALHRDVWRHRTVFADYDRKAGAILRLAPCLRSVWVSWNMLLLVSTRCAVSELVLTVEQNQTGNGINTAVLAVVIRNQEALGRLKVVQVTLRPVSLTCADALMRTLVTTSGLEWLTVRGRPPSTVRRVAPAPVSLRPSLKNFHCELTRCSESFVNAVLATHAATLEEVDLCSGGDGYLGHEWGLTFQLLSTMAGLHSLRCACLPGLEALAACGALTSVWLEVRLYSRGAIDAAADFLRRAEQLQTVTLDYRRCGSRYRPPEFVGNLIEALVPCGRGGRPRLEMLRLLAPPQLQPLLRVLPSLTGLRHLTLRARLSTELLVGITPSTAPSLRLLELEILSLNYFACTHAWLHMWSHTIKTVLVVNPLLHILVREQFYCDDCLLCAMHCHREFDWEQSDGCYLFLHGNDKCPTSVDHSDKSYAWFNFLDFIPGL